MQQCLFNKICNVGLCSVSLSLIKVVQYTHTHLLRKQRPSKNYQALIGVLHISVPARLYRTQSLFSWDRFSTIARPLPSGHFPWPKTAAEWNQWETQHKPHTHSHTDRVNPWPHPLVGLQMIDRCFINKMTLINTTSTFSSCSLFFFFSPLSLFCLGEMVVTLIWMEGEVNLENTLTGLLLSFQFLSLPSHTAPDSLERLKICSQ